ncbi:hypothetical protein LUZ61_015875 [Rhynchospora tenuis]|uniref:F-box domain-containing protein n=1 Tax=Rhynchospora tenuis TaxID=198213 RepID=A0AAD5Z4G2_9POAL|nr:hypothetical protein LUZ61_015875 [Rhynchospora tenuis]
MTGGKVNVQLTRTTDDRISSIYPKRKRQKKEHVDHISDLPDQTLTHVLSYLSTKEAVQTSLLAKRYRNLWAAAPILDFDFHDFLPSVEEAEEDVWIDDHSDPTPATTWLDIVAKLKPKFMTAVIFTESYNFQVPDSVFTSESLHELVFELAYEAISPRSVNLPRLKMLTFKCIEIKDGVMEKLLSGLPSLEEMVLHDCILDSGCISSGTLKHLVLDGCHYETTYPPEILISIPSLASLEINICDMGILKFKKLESLEKAHIHFEELSDEEPLFLTALSNVTSLELVLSISAQMASTVSDTEINLQLGNRLDILEINFKKNDKSVEELVKSVKTHFQTIREANNNFSEK